MERTTRQHKSGSICGLSRSVPPDTFQSLIVSLVISRLDYGNAVLVGLPVYLVAIAPSTVGAERGSTIDLSYEIRGPHH